MSKFQDHKDVAKKHNLGGDWYSFESGENKIKILAEPAGHASHYLKAEKRGVTCAGDASCDYCIKGEKANVRFFTWVIDRKDSEVKPAWFPYSVFKGIGLLSEGSEYGFTDVVPPYDVIVNATGEGLERRYTVNASRKDTPLSDEEKSAFLKVSNGHTPSEFVAKQVEKNPPVYAGVKEEIPVVEENEGETPF